jgi:hypothetical protein
MAAWWTYFLVCAMSTVNTASGWDKNTVPPIDVSTSDRFLTFAIPFPTDTDICLLIYHYPFLHGATR